MTAEAKRLTDRPLVNLLIGAAATIIVTIGIPGIVAIMGWPNAPTGKSWGILVAACFGIVAKLFASETATGEFEFYKFGYDLCATALGGLLTALAIQLSSTVDMFRGFAAIGWLPTFGRTDADARTIQLVGCFALTWFFVFVTARICRGVKEGKIPPRGAFSFSSAVIGGFFLAIYSLLLAAKG